MDPATAPTKDKTHAHEVGRLLAGTGALVMCGGTGVMTTAAAGERSHDRHCRRDSGTGRVPNLIAHANDVVRAVAFSPGGHILVSGSSNHKVGLWDTDPDEAIKNICSLIVTPIAPASGGNTSPTCPINSPVRDLSLARLQLSSRAEPVRRCSLPEVGSG